MNQKKSRGRMSALTGAQSQALKIAPGWNIVVVWTVAILVLLNREAS